MIRVLLSAPAASLSARLMIRPAVRLAGSEPAGRDGLALASWAWVARERIVEVTEPGASAARFSLRTVWTQNLQTPLRRFLRTETGSAVVLLAATLAALAWANIDPSGYAATWRTELVIRSGTIGLADSWQGWVNSGLMAFFFLVAGLEARREFDMGELRERRRLALPLVVALGGMVVPIAIYLAINAGRSSASGWGAAMSTDTAFALGALALAGRACRTGCAPTCSRSRSSMTWRGS